MAGFDIIGYISGLTGFIFDKSVLERIANERGVASATSYSDIDERTRELMRADLLYTAYCSPNTMASVSHQHGSYSKSYGSQTIMGREKLYEMFMSIYRKYGDPMAQSVGSSNLQWMD